jgi:UDP-glucose 4-epimerase
MGRDSDATSIIGTNCLGTQQMLSVAGRWTSTCFVYVSSIGVIGSPRELPITEEHPTMPLTAYHASKLFGEHLARVADSDQTSTVALRLTSPVGVGMPWDRIFSTFTRRALAGDPLVVAGTGGRRQDYVDVSDVAAAVELCLRKTASGIYNIASGSSISNIDLARKCVETLGSSSRIEAGADADPQEELRWDVSTERAKQMLGYAPRVELAQTIRAIAEEHARSAHC